jgi:DNA-directed RNA polymerase subunit M/transcription elongation factor TFIIS
MKIKKCDKCNKTPKIKKDKDNWIISCPSCGMERTFIYTLNKTKEETVKHHNLVYNSLVNQIGDDIILEVRITPNGQTLMSWKGAWDDNGKTKKFPLTIKQLTKTIENTIKDIVK